MPGGSEPGQRHAPNGAGSVYRETITRADGSTYIRWTGALSLGNGTRKKVTGRTQKAVVAELAKLKAEQASGTPIATERQTVAEYLEWWLHNSLRCKPTSFRAYEVLVRVHLAPRLGKRPVRKLEPEHVEQMMGAMRKDGVSDDRINKVRSCLVQALNVLVKRRRISFNAAALVDPYTVERVEPPPLEPEECERWLAAFRDERIGPLCILAMATGLRQGELLGLSWHDDTHPDGDLDLAHARVRISRQVQVYRATPDAPLRPGFLSPKTAAARRWIPLPSFVLTVLASHRERQRFLESVLGEYWQDNNLVFPNGRGGLADASDIRRVYHTVRDAAGLPPMPFHGLRHVYRSLLRHLGVDSSTAQRLMGHAGPAISERYNHVPDSAMRAAADRIDALLRDATERDAPSGAPMRATGSKIDG